MTDFLSRLPAPTRLATNESIVATDASLASYSLVSTNAKSEGPVAVVSGARGPPAYGCRQGWLPRTLEDFGDGGAFPEILVAQFPLDMGRSGGPAGGGQSSAIVALQTGEDGQLQYDSVIRQGLSGRVAVHTRPEDAKPLWSASSELQKPKEEEAEATEQRTKAALEAALQKKTSRGVVKSVNQQPEYIKYTPNEQAPGHNAHCAQRIIRMVEAQVDPLEPPKFRHRRVPAGPPSPPPAILRSPPRKLSAQDQAAWRIPPCISNWKNQRGYTIPLDKRLQADGRNLQDVSINDKFASLSESLYIAERAAREEIRLRNDLLKQKKQQEESVREEQLRELAAKARAERAALIQKSTETEQDATAAAKRWQVENERRRELERDIRLERAGKRSKRARDEDRDISERVALGQAKPTAQESLFDSRLFNQSAGMDSGFDAGDDEKYNLYDKPLFADRSKESIYRFDRERMAQSVGSMSAVPAFAGADSSRQRTAPVEFEADTTDPFGLASLIDSTKRDDPKSS